MLISIIHHSFPIHLASFPTCMNSYCPITSIFLSFISHHTHFQTHISSFPIPVTPASFSTFYPISCLSNRPRSVQQWGSDNGCRSKPLYRIVWEDDFLSSWAERSGKGVSIIVKEDTAIQGAHKNFQYSHREATGEQVDEKIGAESLVTGFCNSAVVELKLGGYSESGFCIQSDGVSFQLEYRASI